MIRSVCGVEDRISRGSTGEEDEVSMHRYTTGDYTVCAREFL